ncbi:stage V sporulation protein B [Kandleria vitulina]|uniref:putative polysaccharide biosynthesis protein n=1 Tax=Kandleria vitulina TaxID=1630 RepID=UPI0008AB3C9B|nr:polysaccharide biosynthesis protein [Kandleria vitulina]SEI89206.1 stage V sporulation protein B [Kandleria vitulina]
MNKSKTVVKQAGILALAGIVVRIIGVLYRSPLTRMIGDLGNGYYSTAYNVYAMILLLSSYSIPTAISKLISEKIALEEYGNARKIFKCALIYISIIGSVVATITFIAAPFALSAKGAAMTLQVLCPTIFFSGLVGVMRGYFQAHNTTKYTSISQIVEQLLNAIVSVGAAYLFIKGLGANSSHVAKASLGSAGSALGTGAGVLIALIYLVYKYFKDHGDFEESKNVNENERIATTKEIFKSILTIVTPIIIATCVYNLVTIIDMSLYYMIMNFRGLGHDAATSLYGVYAGKYTVLMNVPVALASAMSTASIPAISSSYALDNLKDVRANIENSISVAMLVIIPCAVGLAVLSYPIMGVLFPQKATLSLAATTLTIGSCATIFYGLSTISNGILQAISHPNIPLKNAAVALVTHLIILAALLLLIPSANLHEFSLYSLAIGSALYALQMCITNQRALVKLVHFKYKWKRIFILPLIAAVIMGVVAYGSYTVLFMFTHRVLIPLVAAIGLAIIVYFVVILYLYKDHPDTIYNIPYMDKIASRFYKK